jgi:hypothetical protein
MATTPAAFYNLYRHLGGSDGVIADRYIKGSVLHPQPTLARKVFSRIYNAVIRAMFLMHYRDTQCGAKIFKRTALENIVPTIGMTKWAFDIELLYKLKKEGYQISTAPTIWSSKDYSKINLFSSGPMMVLGIIRLRILNSPFKRAIRVYDFFAEMARKVITK